MRVPSLPISIIYYSLNLVSTVPLQPPSPHQSPGSLPLGFSYRTYLLLLAVFFLKFTAYFGAGSIAVGALVNAVEAVAAPCSAAGTHPRPPRSCGTAGTTRPSTAPWQGGGPRPGPGRGGAAACGPQHVEATAWSGGLGRRVHLQCRALRALPGGGTLASSVSRRRAVLPQWRRAADVSFGMCYGRDLRNCR